jgi:hypothetical protein
VSDAGRESQDEPTVEYIDKEAEQHELEAAGWERIEREGKIVWRNPDSGYLYPQGAAIALVRGNAEYKDVPKEPEGGA